MKKFIFILFLSTFYFFFKAYAFASSNFLTDYNVIYTVSNNANTNVKIGVTFTNTSDIYYASSYRVQVGFNDIKNVRAQDPGGAIIPNITKQRDGQAIDLLFNSRVVGKGNKLYFTLSFDTKRVAQKKGKIWEINIPGMLKQSDFSSFNATVIVPEDFGAPSYIKPFVKNSYYQSNSFSFSKNQLGNSGISITFGNEQIYSFNLKYHLYNNNLFPIRTEIALPPSTNYQNVAIEDISPAPLNILKDQDGNWLAQYHLLPSQKINPVVKGKVKIWLRPKKEELTKSDLSNYLKEEPYWQTSNSEIKAIASNLKTPNAIYNYVVKKLSYDFLRVLEEKPRLGALEALNNPSSAVCLEFTDLYIALSRAAGIPAREIDGFAYTENPKERPLSLVKDVLHAWPEYYDNNQKKWIMVDPTWANTTGGIDYFNVLDFDHFAFVIKGKSSTYPIPAGGYKLSDNTNSKDVEVNFSDNFSYTSPLVNISKNLPIFASSGLPIKGEITIKNTGKILYPGGQVIIDAVFLKPPRQRIFIDQIPPYGFTTIPLNFEKTPFLTNMSGVIKITLAGSSLYHKITISPFFLNGWFILGGVLIVIVFTIILLFITRKFRNLHLFGQAG